MGSGSSTTLAVELIICTVSTVIPASTLPLTPCTTTWLVVTVLAIDPSRSFALPQLLPRTASVCLPLSSTTPRSYSLLLTASCAHPPSSSAAPLLPTDPAPTSNRHVLLITECWCGC